MARRAVAAQAADAPAENPTVAPVLHGPAVPLDPRLRTGRWRHIEGTVSPTPTEADRAARVRAAHAILGTDPDFLTRDAYGDEPTGERARLSALQHTETLAALAAGQPNPHSMTRPTSEPVTPPTPAASTLPMPTPASSGPAPWTHAPIDPVVLARAVKLEVKPGIAGTVGRLYLVGEHYVILNAHLDEPPCDCGDHEWRNRLCKHVLAAMLHEGYTRVREALALIPTTEGAPGGAGSQP